MSYCSVSKTDLCGLLIQEIDRLINIIATRINDTLDTNTHLYINNITNMAEIVINESICDILNNVDVQKYIRLERKEKINVSRRKK
jgi:hypothetical protein